MADERNVKYLTAQVDDEYFRQVKIRLIERNMTMRDAIVCALNQYLDLGGAGVELSTADGSTGNETLQGKEE